MILRQYGRETKNYLPFASSSNNGLYKDNALSEQLSFNQNWYSSQGENFFYSQTDFESSPLNRPTKIMAQGNNWVGSSRGTEIKYWVNTVNDDVKIWSVQNVSGSFGSYSMNGVYAPGQLIKNVSIDEHGKQTIQFIDNQGKLILKKVQFSASSDDGSGSGHGGWICTYNIYDDLGQLRAVIQPEGVITLAANSWDINYSSGVLLNEQVFRYEYDDRGRMVIKKLPGADELWMVYDRWDKLVLTQDGNQRLLNNWSYIKYDELNRLIVTGLHNDPGNITLDQINAHLKQAESWQIKYESKNASAIGYTLTQTYPYQVESSVLKITHYDDYNWTNNIATVFRNFDNSFSFPAASNTTYPYRETVAANNSTRGLVTGTITRVAGVTLLASVNFYDEKGRIIQNKSENFTGGCDITTTQYSFIGHPLQTYQKQEKLGTNPQTHIVTTKNDLDDLGRVWIVSKTISSTINGQSVSKPENIPVSYSYNKLGQLSRKRFATPYNNWQGLTQLNCDYNIRGWLLGVNRSYLKDRNASDYQDNFFGFELGYDKVTTTPGSANDGQLNYNGNIYNSVWKSAGDGARRNYAFFYDNANRFGRANFYQNTNEYSGGAWNTQGANFGVHGFDADNNYYLKYDANGNIKGMVEHGIKGVNPDVYVDALRYEYFTNSNKLRMVHDDYSDVQTKLGDFHNGNEGFWGTDYGYDKNGNTVTDRNKFIEGTTGMEVTSGGAISYNHLDLPTYIPISGKGSIQYIYDGLGNKLKKITTDNSTAGKTIITTTTYIGGFVYESKEYSNPDPGQVNYTDVLQYIAHEEGRIRFKTAGATPASFEYDYFITDHLGNIRMVLTEEQKTDQYPQVSFEDANVNTEQLYYENVNLERTARPGAFDISGTNGNIVQLLRKSTQAIGAGKLLKVMAGDKIHSKVDYYIPNDATDNNNANGLSSIITNLISLLNGVNAPSAIKGEGSPVTTNLNNNPFFTSLLSQQGSSVYSSMPKAYLNILFFDEQFKFIEMNSEVVQVTTKGSGQQLIRFNKSVPKNGYVYVYINNESTNLVYFDNFLVTHERGRILEETHYYPFGLTMAGISSRAVGMLENKKHFNGIDHTTELDLNQYDAFYRNLDPQIGRFRQIDPQVDNLKSYSPYESMGNNPISNIDPLGDFKSWFGAFRYWIGHGGSISQNVFGEWYVYKKSSLSLGGNNIGIKVDVKFGKGRFRDLAQRERWLKAFENNERNEELIRRGVYERVSVEEANERTLSTISGAFLPNVLKLGTVSSGTSNAVETSTALVAKYPANPAIAGTTERTFLMPGQIIDRYGPLGGKWFSEPGVSYGARSIPADLAPYMQFKVLKPFEVNKSLASPGMFSGQTGFGIQYLSPVGADILIKRGIIAPF